MTKYVNAGKMLEKYEHSIYDTTDLAEMLDYMPAADVVEVKHGRWMDYRRRGIDGTFHWFRQCSACLYERADDNEDKDMPYCPNCGAKMDLEEKTFNATTYTKCKVNLYTETKLRFVLDKYIEDEELIEKILKALDGDEE